MKPRLLHATTVIRRPVKEVFDFFSNAENLNLITPAAFQFKIITPLPIIIQQGALIEYRLKMSGVPFTWVTKITHWQPPHFFEDIQLTGPYSLWIHHHQFRETAEGHTEMTDSLQYLSPGWILEPLVHHLFVKRKVEAIFSYREERLKQLFP